MRPVRLLLLAVVVLALGGYIYFIERHKPTTDEIAARRDKVFPALDQTKAERIVVTNPKGRFELKKENEVWKLVAPIADDANQGAVTSLISSLANLKAERTFKPGEVKLAEYGLDKPALAVTVEGVGGVRAALKLGAEMPLGTGRAAIGERGETYLVGKFIATDIDRDLAGWRSTDLAQVFSPDAVSVTIKNPAGRVSLAHTGNLWTLTEPLSDLADRDRAEGLIGDINGARIKEFVDSPGDLAALGLASPRIEVTIVRGDKKPPIQLAFGNEREADKTKQIACKRGDRVVWVEPSAIAHATAAPSEWRSQRLVALDAWSADKLEIEAGKEKVAIERKDGMWKAGGKDLDFDLISRRLGAMSDLKVVAFDAAKPAGEPLGKIKATVIEGGGRTIEASFYRGATENQDVAIVSGRAGALGVDAVKVKEILADPAALAKPKATPAPPATAAPTPKKK